MACLPIVACMPTMGCLPCPVGHQNPRWPCLPTKTHDGHQSHSILVASDQSASPALPVSLNWQFSHQGSTRQSIYSSTPPTYPLVLNYTLPTYPTYTLETRVYQMYNANHLRPAFRASIVHRVVLHCRHHQCKPPVQQSKHLKHRVQPLKGSD